MSPRPSFRVLNVSRESIPPPYTGPGTGETSTAANISKPAFVSPMAREGPSSRLSSTEALLPPRPPSRQGFFRRHLGLWRALPCGLAAIFWAAQMIYFLFYFTSRPAQEDGSWPRIGPSYAGFPFISCIGAVRELSFKSVSVLVAVLLWTGFGIDYVVGSRSPVGIWWRRGKLLLASTSSVFLIALSFASVDEHHDLHLIFTSFQIICMGSAKGCDWNLARLMRKRTPSNRFLNRSRRWKKVAATIASPCSIMAIIGIYGCSAKIENGKVIFSPVCWSLVSFAAPAEWILSWCWVIYLITVSYDGYHLDYTIHLLLTTPPPRTNRKSYGLAFWRRWTDRYLSSGERKEIWDDDREGLTATAGRLPNERGVSTPNTQVQRSTSDQLPQRARPYSTAGFHGEAPGETDISGILHDADSDVELGWLPPMMPGSVFGGNGYHQVSRSPNIGEA
ncbi:hypothetical protein PV04_00546 [Phialophora macrospora]|uniref:CWH43-like N-terminal domain-containing protein n=1 Tax=Phialophora macrospora TaxID=1851006 RepID=A0A0D2EDG9_9EURO|nr:hypothetical protein PV04_00546 [Phialophora macrospora]